MVAGVAEDFLDRRAEGGQRAQCPVAERSHRSPRRQRLYDQLGSEQGVLTAGDADRDRLGLVFYGVDGACELVDGNAQGFDEVGGDGSGGADLADSAS